MDSKPRRGKASPPSKVKPNLGLRAVPRISNATCAKPEPSDSLRERKQTVASSAKIEDFHSPLTVNGHKRSYPVYNPPSTLRYTPENAFKEGFKMVKVIDAIVDNLGIASNPRKDVWLQDTLSLQSQELPKFMVAVCGATGAGKSSLINAVLDDAIVPTSGMRACTAVVTEISYHEERTIEADVFFLKSEEWVQELVFFQDEIANNNGKVQQVKGKAGITWEKVRAVYPWITLEDLRSMTVDQIMEGDPEITAILGTSKHIVAKNSAAFSKEIGKYIDSKDQKPRTKKRKASSKSKRAEKNNMSSTEGDGSESPPAHEEVQESALWPLISQVKIKCSAKALFSGMVLVDLPGTGDFNQARNSIAKDYMKNCDGVWVLAPIIRAVDDEAAKNLMGEAFKTQLMMDGNYGSDAITFIATKCDEISCSEVAKALQLDDEPVLKEIQESFERITDETRKWEEKKTRAARKITAIEEQLAKDHVYENDCKKRLKALKDGNKFTEATVTTPTNSDVNCKKRKNASKASKGQFKRRKSAGPGDDNSAISDSHKGSDEDFSTSEELASEAKGDEDDEMDEAEETEETVETRLEELAALIKINTEALSRSFKQEREATMALSSLKEKKKKAERRRKAFCSIKRSEYSRDVLKEQFRAGLKDMDDVASEESDPHDFDPSVDLRDYDKINLPVFTCSSRDYIRLKGQVKGDGKPECFSQIEDTGVPDLQSWCHKITSPSRERSSRDFLTQIKLFAASVRDYVADSCDVVEQDRAVMRKKWQPKRTVSKYDSDIDGSSKAANADADVRPAGVTPLLVKEFSEVVENTVVELEKYFRDELEEKCKVGATKAADAAVEFWDTFAEKKHWATMRATVIRQGEFTLDVNAGLTQPLTKTIASSWAATFEFDVFASFENLIKAVVRKLLEDIENSAPLGLKDRATSQGLLCQEETNVVLKKTLDLVKNMMTKEQREASRLISPDVQQQLSSAYTAASTETGKGCLARQKDIMHNKIDELKDKIFEGSADKLMKRLATTAQAVGNALNEALEQLAKKIEVSLAVLWEENRDTRAKGLILDVVVKDMEAMIGQIEAWNIASRNKVEDVN